MANQGCITSQLPSTQQPRGVKWPEIWKWLAGSEDFRPLNVGKNSNHPLPTAIDPMGSQQFIKTENNSIHLTFTQ